MLLILNYSIIVLERKEFSRYKLSFYTNNIIYKFKHYIRISILIYVTFFSINDLSEFEKTLIVPYFFIGNKIFDSIYWFRFIYSFYPYYIFYKSKVSRDIIFIEWILCFIDLLNFITIVKYTQEKFFYILYGEECKKICDKIIGKVSSSDKDENHQVSEFRAFCERVNKDENLIKSNVKNFEEFYNRIKNKNR